MQYANAKPRIALRGWRLLLGAAPLAGVAYLGLVAAGAHRAGLAAQAAGGPSYWLRRACRASHAPPSGGSPPPTP